MIYKNIILIVGLFVHSATWSQSILGKWKTIDDETDEPKSIVEIFERNGKVYGRIIKLYRRSDEDQDPICDKCDEDDLRFKSKVIGMEILKGMMKDSNEYSGGEILDPNNGKVYRCKIWLEGKDLKLRGYLGPFFRTQTWVKDHG